MAKEIAVFVGQEGATATLCEQGRIIVFTRWSQKWQISRELPFTLAGDQTLRLLRQKMSEVLGFLAECTIFVGQSVSGLPYFELEKGQISVWEFEGIPSEFLDYVWAKEEESRLQAASQPGVPAIPVPTDLGNGCYRISIQEIQQNNSGITSKQILLPVLQQRGFYQLEVLCSHLPPWLEFELTQGKFVGVVEKQGPNQLKVMITPKPCIL